MSLVPTAYAATPATVTMSGTYHGICRNPPVSSAFNYIPLYGTGTQDEHICDFGYQNSLIEADPQSAVLAGSGEPAIGAGTLSQLVVYGQGNGTVYVWVLRAGQPLDTGITCAISGNSLNRCYDTTHTFALSDGDMVVYVLGYAAGSSPSNITAYISKT